MAELAPERAGRRGDRVVLDVRSRAFSTDLHRRRRRPARARVPAAGGVRARRPTRCWSAGSRPTAASTRCRATGRLTDGIAAERALLTRAGEADLWIDTSDLNVHQLRATLEKRSPATARAAGHGPLLRVQVRPAAGRRPGGRRPLPAQPALGPELRPLTGQDPAVRDYVLGQPGAGEFLDRYADLVRLLIAGYRARGQAVPDHRGRLHRRQAPQRGHRRGVRPPARASAGWQRTPATAIWAASERARGSSRSAAATGLAASLRALRRASISTWRSRRGHGRRRRRVLRPDAPRDARPAAGRPAQALAALAGDDDARAGYGVLLQHRFGGTGRSPGTRSATSCSPGWRRCTATRCARSTTLGRCSAPRPGAADVRRPAGPRGGRARASTRPPGRSVARSAGRSRSRRRRGTCSASCSSPRTRRPARRCSSDRAADWLCSARAPGTPPCCRTCSCRGCARRSRPDAAPGDCRPQSRPSPARRTAGPLEEHLHGADQPSAGVAR